MVTDTQRIPLLAALAVLTILGLLLLGWQRVDAADCEHTRVAVCDGATGGAPQLYGGAGGVPQA